jgi:ABC-type glutathione transport system ATPase component
VRAIDDFHLDLRAGEAFGIIGGRGAGKSTLARALTGLVPATSGSIRFEGAEIVGQPARRRKVLLRGVQLIAQQPLAGLRRRANARQFIADPLRRVRPKLSAAERATRIAAAAERMGFTAARLDESPLDWDAAAHLRLALARALAAQPRILICDQPWTALDGTAQLEALALLQQLRSEFALSLILLDCTLDLVPEICERAAVLYLGRVMEQAPALDLCARPAHPYTRTLRHASPDTDTAPEILRAGCVYRLHCELAESSICAGQRPPLRKIASRQYAACHFVTGG